MCRQARDERSVVLTSLWLRGTFKSYPHFVCKTNFQCFLHILTLASMRNKLFRSKTTTTRQVGLNHLFLAGLLNLAGGQQGGVSATFL